jgi:hypothetical protein
MTPLTNRSRLVAGEWQALNPLNREGPLPEFFVGRVAAPRSAEISWVAHPFCGLCRKDGAAFC